MRLHLLQKSNVDFQRWSSDVPTLLASVNFLTLSWQNQSLITPIFPRFFSLVRIYHRARIASFTSLLGLLARLGRSTTHDNYEMPARIPYDHGSPIDKRVLIQRIFEERRRRFAHGNFLKIFFKCFLHPSRSTFRLSTPFFNFFFMKKLHNIHFFITFFEQNCDLI